MLQNCTVSVVGEGQDMKIYDDDEVQQFLALIEGEERSRGAGRKDPPADNQPEEEADRRDPAVAGPQAQDPEVMDQS